MKIGRLPWAVIYQLFSDFQLGAAFARGGAAYSSAGQIAYAQTTWIFSFRSATLPLKMQN
ncbi:hypothetical protein [Comamonas sp. MYb396]|uniref:hypothetical protein n=1 Tax=Comamonas sp. MYb396 TaxID=2745302 RepID=UPI003098156C